MFKLPEGKDQLGSLGGCICTLILFLACFFYGTMQAVKLFTFDETDIMVSSVDAFFDAEFVYSDHFMFAFGITAYDGNRESIEDPSIGLLKAYTKSWGIFASSGIHL